MELYLTVDGTNGHYVPSIADNWNVDVHELVKLNKKEFPKLRWNSKLRHGTVIRIPPSANATDAEISDVAPVPAAVVPAAVVPAAVVPAAVVPAAVAPAVVAPAVVAPAVVAPAAVPPPVDARERARARQARLLESTCPTGKLYYANISASAHARRNCLTGSIM